jgi:hypothetical protein
MTMVGIERDMSDHVQQAWSTAELVIRHVTQSVRRENQAYAGGHSSHKTVSGCRVSLDRR